MPRPDAILLLLDCSELETDPGVGPVTVTATGEGAASCCCDPGVEPSTLPMVRLKKPWNMSRLDGLTSLVVLSCLGLPLLSPPTPTAGFLCGDGTSSETSSSAKMSSLSWLRWALLPRLKSDSDLIFSSRANSTLFFDFARGKKLGGCEPKNLGCREFDS